MGAPPDTQQRLPPLASALQSFLSAHPPPPDSPHLTSHHNLALQIAHNLHYQHLWTHIYLHTHSPPPPSSSSSSSSSTTTTKPQQPPLPRPILSGLPPQRLYVHPDEQISLLQAQKDQGKAGMPDLAREREWVLPSHLRETWSLRRFGEVLDGICAAVPAPGEENDDDDDDDDEENDDDDNRKAQAQAQLLFGELPGDADARRTGREEAERGVNEWRNKLPKRVLLATLDDDSTVVYYIVHDGIVKPRQN